MINKIEFKRTSNIFLNSGIVSLDYYLEKFKKETEIKYQLFLDEDKLVIEAEKLLLLLEDVYYYMGKEIYDTSGKKAREEANKYYFIKNPFKAEKFPKMKTYGLASLITNDPQPFPKKENDAEYFKNLIIKDNEFAKKIAEFYRHNRIDLKHYEITDGKIRENKNQKKGDSRIFLNSPYIKITKLEIDKVYFEGGKNKCYLTGESYKKLVDTQCTSPFFSGINNFNSHLSHDDKKICWKAMYLSRFSPKLSFHTYTGGLNTIMVYMFNTDNLLNLKKLFNRNSDIYKNKIELIETSYSSSFRIDNFSKKKDMSKDYTEKNEYLFMLIYTFYKKLLEENNVDIESTSHGWDPFAETEFAKIPISLISIRSDKFASTMRPDSFEEINNFKWIIRLITHFEKNHIGIYNVLQSLKLIKPSERKSQDSYRLERQVRNNVLGKIIKAKSILPEIETLFYDCFRYRIAGEYIGFKSYKDLLQMLSIYEKITNYGGNENMNETLQQRAINLGKSIGQGILNYENPGDYTKKKLNAKGGRSYIISLKKARTLPQFFDEIIRIQTKYGVSVSNDILVGINQQNFIIIKQFCIISALNQINAVLNLKKKEVENE